MTRDPDALHAFLAERAAAPFAWGRSANDCVGFVLEGIRRQTARDPLPDVDWNDEESAAATIAGLGGLEHALDARLRSIAPALACRGDVAGVPDTRFGVSLLIVEGSTLVGPGRRELKRLPRSAMIRAWSIEGGLP